MSEADFLEEEGPKGLRNSGLRCEVPESPLSEHRSESVDSGNHRRTSSISSLDLESTVAKKRAKDRLHELIKGALQTAIDEIYFLCEYLTDKEATQEFLKILAFYQSEFERLRARIVDQIKFEEDNDRGGIAWEVRKDFLANHSAGGLAFTEYLNEAARLSPHSGSLSPRFLPSPTNSPLRREETGDMESSIGSGLEKEELREQSFPSPKSMRSLHEKLSSPDRSRRDPETSSRIYEEKQARAKERRERIVEEMQGRLRSWDHKVKDLGKRQEDDRAKKQLFLEEKLDKAEQARESYIQAIVQKASSENMKVDEVAFINDLEKQSKYAIMLSRLEHGERRRRQQYELARLKLRQEAEKEKRAQRRREELELARVEKTEEKLKKLEYRDSRISWNRDQENELGLKRRPPLPPRDERDERSMESIVKEKSTEIEDGVRRAQTWADLMSSPSSTGSEPAAANEATHIRSPPARHFLEEERDIDPARHGDEYDEGWTTVTRGRKDSTSLSSSSQGRRTPEAPNASPRLRARAAITSPPPFSFPVQQRSGSISLLYSPSSSETSSSPPPSPVLRPRPKAEMQSEIVEDKTNKRGKATSSKRKRKTKGGPAKQSPVLKLPTLPIMSKGQRSRVKRIKQKLLSLRKSLSVDETANQRSSLQKSLDKQKYGEVKKALTVMKDEERLSALKGLRLSEGIFDLGRKAAKGDITCLSLLTQLAEDVQISLLLVSAGFLALIVSNIKDLSMDVAEKRVDDQRIVTTVGLAGAVVRTLYRTVSGTVPCDNEELQKCIESHALPSVVQLCASMDIFTAIARLLEVFASTNMLPSMGTKSNMIMFLTVLGLCYSSELEKRRIFEEAGEADPLGDVAAAMSRSPFIGSFVRTMGVVITDDSGGAEERSSYSLALLSFLNLCARADLVLLQHQLLTDETSRMIMRIVEASLYLITSSSPPVLDEEIPRVKLLEELLLLVGYLPLNCDEGREAITLPCTKGGSPFLHTFAKLFPITLLSSPRGRALLLPSLISCLAREDDAKPTAENGCEEKRWRVSSDPSLASCQMILSEEVDVIGLLVEVLEDESKGLHKSLPLRLLPRKRIPGALFDPKTVAAAIGDV